MDKVPVSARLGKYDLGACLEHLRQQNLAVEDESVIELDAEGDELQWTFRAPMSTVDILG